VSRSRMCAREDSVADVMQRSLQALADVLTQPPTPANGLVLFSFDGGGSRGVLALEMLRILGEGAGGALSWRPPPRSTNTRTSK
jgi:hypothetical protein